MKMRLFSVISDTSILDSNYLGYGILEIYLTRWREMKAVMQITR